MSLMLIAPWVYFWLLYFCKKLVLMKDFWQFVMVHMVHSTFFKTWHSQEYLWTKTHPWITRQSIRKHCSKVISFINIVVHIYSLYDRLILLNMLNSCFSYYWLLTPELKNFYSLPYGHDSRSFILVLSQARAT